MANDPSFTSDLQIIPIQDNGTELYADYTFANNQYFTFGTVPLTLNGVVIPVVCQGGNARVDRFELSSTVLETVMLPLHHTPKL